MVVGFNPRLTQIAGMLSLWMAAATCGSPAHAQTTTPATPAGQSAATLNNLNSRGVFELLQEIESLKREVAGLRGELETQAFTLEQLRKSQAATYNDLDQRLRVLDTGVAAAPALPVLQATPSDAVAGAPAAQGDLQVQTDMVRPAAIPGGASDATVPAAPPALDPVTGLPLPLPAPQPGTLPAPGQMAVQQTPPDLQSTPAPVSTPEAPVAPLPSATTSDDAGSEAAYRDAFALLKSGEYDQAIAAFDAFQQQYPTSQYGDNAQFWLAEAHYVKRDFAAALPAYQKMLANYPASKKLSHALLKIGYSHSELGQVAEARTALTELQQRFPGSAAAQLAEQRIAQLPAN